MDYNNLLKILQSAQVKQFYIHHVEMNDLLQRYYFTIITNSGTFTSDVRFVDEVLNNMSILFKPEFGNMLKNALIEKIKEAIEYNKEETLCIDYILFTHFNFRGF